MCLTYLLPDDDFIMAILCLKYGDCFCPFRLVWFPCRDAKTTIMKFSLRPKHQIE